MPHTGSPSDGFEPAIDPNPVVRLTASGISPQVTHVLSQTQIVFVNQDSVEQRIVAAPDLQYGECPEVDTVGVIRPGETRTLVLGRYVLCAFRDANRPGQRAFEGLLFVH